jgi:hypothetical protein
MIEQILNAVEKPKVPLYDNEFVGRIEALERAQRRPVQTEDLNARFTALENMVTKMFVEIESMKRQRPAEPVVKSVVITPTPAPSTKKVAAPPHWEEEEPEVEEEELELEEFEYKGRTFFKDQNNMVYALDEEGEMNTDEPIGQWNGKRIVPVSA